MNFFCQYHHIYLTLLVSLTLVVLGCEQKAQQERHEQSSTAEHYELPDFESVDTDQVFVYNCSDTLQFTAHVTKDSTWLFLSDTTLKVMPVKAGSGARYEGNSYLYWSKDNEAILQKPQGSFTTCQFVPEERSWAAAKLRGVDFRALGQEPGWFLEIQKEDQLKYVGNYGADTLIVEPPVPETDHQGRRTVYRAKSAQQTLELVIAETPCTDNMSGFDFPQTVTITVDGETYRGCGRYLQ
ncbi:MliC family protein [Fodinibius sp. AD559]|uniref:MliC family protein n=1 Tax=Fodinibius sp. AD559 TaxID=3424179 RepID=UPI004046A5FB